MATTRICAAIPTSERSSKHRTLLGALTSGALTCVEREDLDEEDDTRGYEEVVPAERTAASPSAVLAGLQLRPEYIVEVKRLREAFADAEPDSGPAERLLEHLVAGEVAIAMALADSEAALASLFQKTLTDPRLAVEVAKVLREATGLSTAVRRRIQHSLGAVADLRAQRKFLDGRRGKNGV